LDEKEGLGLKGCTEKIRHCFLDKVLGRTIPVYYVNGLPKMIDAQHFQSILPEVEIFTTEDGLPPLGNADVWAWDTATNKVVNTDLVDNKIIFP
jgi:leucyl-tRNA synthetase